MTDRDRLEDIKNNHMVSNQGSYKTTSIGLDDMEWLIEQADKTQKLEDSKAFYKHLSDSYVSYGNDKLDQVLRYREALKFYADENNHDSPIFDEHGQFDGSLVDKDNGEKARQALENK